MSHLKAIQCTKFDFGWSSALDPAGGAYSAERSPDRSWIDFRRPTSKGRDGITGRKGEKKEGEWKGRRGKGSTI